MVKALQVQRSKVHDFRAIIGNYMSYSLIYSAKSVGGQLLKSMSSIKITVSDWKQTIHPKEYQGKDSCH